MHDAGIVRFYNVEESATGGAMPARSLVLHSWQYYEERSIGVTRMYAARGANCQIDGLIRVWQDRSIMPDMIAIIEDGLQYRIDSVQHTVDDDGIKVTDLTLIRLGECYDVDE